MDDITQHLETPPVGAGGAAGQVPARAGTGVLAKAQPLPPSKARSGAASGSDPEMYEQEWRGLDEQRSQIKTSQSGREVSFSFVYSNSNGETRPKGKKRGETGAREPGSQGARE